MKVIIAAPVTLAVVYRAWSQKSVTPVGIVVAVFTAIAHAIHPWNLPFALLIVFFLAGTRVTKVKHDVKAKLTIQASGNSGGEGARTHIQVLANCGVAAALTLLHTYQLSQREKHLLPSRGSVPGCYPWAGDLLVVGIVANYAAVAADTFSSELGILSKTQPRLITSLRLRKVPPGTNGGVTLWGLVAGLLGSLIIATTSMALIPFCPPPSSLSALGDDSGWNIQQRLTFTLAMTVWGALGSVLDSLLGGWLQQSVVDTRTGRIVEGQGGKNVLVTRAGPTNTDYKKRADAIAQLVKVNQTSTGEIDMNGMGKYDAKKKYRTPSFGNEKPSRVVESGSVGLLDNNGVNFLMALMMSVGAIGVASWAWGVPLESISR